MINPVEISEIKKLSRSILSQLNQFEGKKVLIVGDIGLDEYVLGDVKRISPEAPVPVLEVRSQDKRVGLSANVAQNVVSLGGEALLLGVVGNDNTANDLKGLLKSSNVATEYLVVDKDRPTTRKMRVMSENHHLVRVDFEKKSFLSTAATENLLEKFELALKECDAVILQDYAKGVISEGICQRVIKRSREVGKKVLLDPHRSTPVSYYHGADLFKPNRDESFILSGLNLDELRTNNESIEKVADALIEKVGCENLVLTLGKEGMILFSNGESSALPTYARQVFDVTGAGDTVLAALSLAWASGLDLKNSCLLANYAAGVVVGKVGCVPCSQVELKEYILQYL